MRRITSLGNILLESCSEANKICMWEECANKVETHGKDVICSVCFAQRMSVLLQTNGSRVVKRCAYVGAIISSYVWPLATISAKITTSIIIIAKNYCCLFVCFFFFFALAPLHFCLFLAFSFSLQFASSSLFVSSISFACSLLNIPQKTPWIASS